MNLRFPGKSELIDATLAVFLIGIAMFPAIIHLNGGSIPEYLLNEDGLYENMAAYICLLTFAFLIYPIVQIGKSNKLVLFWLLCFAISMLVIGGEEISWGQRLIGFETPPIIAENNFQQEFNLHNSKLIQSGNNTLSVILTQLLVAYLLVLPLFVGAFPTASKFTNLTKAPVPNFAVALTVITAKLISTQTYRLIYGTTETADKLSLGESFETVLELCLCWVAAIYALGALRLHKSRANKKQS